ncbi:MAG: hypothetical protein KAX31_02160, partial [Thermoplasmata archaeon]|nr:hypothetical protein [Thermoplasmata archaeon]
MKRKLGRKIISIVLTVVLISLLFVPFYQSSPINEKKTSFPVGWTDDIRITDNAISDRKVQISVDGSEVHLTWRQIIGNMEVFHMHSNDSGKSWANPIQISSSGIGADNPDVAVNNSITHIVWQDWKTPSVEIFYRNS